MKIEGTRKWLAALCVSPVVLVSCEKAKEMVMEVASQSSGSAAPDPGLAKLVDRTEEGVSFRRDVEFPARVEVVSRRSSRVSGRVFRASVLERGGGKIDGLELSVTKLESDGEVVRYTVLNSSFLKPGEGEEDLSEAGEKALESLAADPKPLVFRKSGGSWKADPASGFRAAALARELAGSFDTLLIDGGVAARRVWFSEGRRFKPGDRVEVSGASLGMLVAGRAQGKLELTFEGEEAVNGHPCGVFSVKGSYRRRGMRNFEGEVRDEDVTIESGKVWLSLVHPLVLREELETIQTYQSGPEGGLVERVQGAAKVSVSREWKAL